jgi:hypothetical protein
MKENKEITNKLPTKVSRFKKSFYQKTGSDKGKLVPTDIGNTGLF